MRCPNCHGEIEEDLVTCTMCGHILDYDNLDIDEDLDESERILFLIKHNLLFLIKLVSLIAILIFTSLVVILAILDPSTEWGLSSLIFPILVILVVIGLIIVVIKGKRRW